MKYSSKTKVTLPFYIYIIGGIATYYLYKELKK